MVTADNDDLVGGRRLLCQMTGVKLGAAHCSNWIQEYKPPFQTAAR